MLDRDYRIHSRSIFNIFDLIGALGGVLDIFIYMFAVLFTVSEQSFVIKAISKLYLTRTKNSKLFNSASCSGSKLKVDNSLLETCKINPNLANEINRHKVIKLNLKEQF